jgi:hypothetical protein
VACQGWARTGIQATIQTDSWLVHEVSVAEVSGYAASVALLCFCLKCVREPLV